MNPQAEFFYCPYCSEENLFPVEDDAWRCAACLRTFVVALISYGLGKVRSDETSKRA
jgi:ribosomal protein L37AE/L43A